MNSDSVTTTSVTPPKGAIYEIINPSDACTIRADSDLIAWLAMILVSDGAYGVKNIDGPDRKIPFVPFGLTEDGAKKVLLDDFGVNMSLIEAIDANLVAIAECLESFAYGSAVDRNQYERAVSYIDDPVRRAAFIAEVRDQRRSSMSNIGAACDEWAATCRCRAETLSVTSA